MLSRSEGVWGHGRSSCRGSGEAPWLDASGMFWARCLGGGELIQLVKLPSHWFLGPELTFTGEEPGLPVSLGSPRGHSAMGPQGLWGACLSEWLEEKQNWGRKNFVKI